MCGISGLNFTSKSNLLPHEINYYRHLMTEMLINNEARGNAAAGIVVVNYDFLTKKSKVNMLKAPLSARKFVKTEAYKKIINTIDKNTMFAVGHTRAATSGSATDNMNNHPHVYGRFVGVHNGMIEDQPLWNSLAPDFKPKSRCDSEAFFAFMDSHVSKGDTIGQAARKFAAMVRGWYAFAFFDLKDIGKLYIAKDERTPLVARYSILSDALVFASDENHIKKAIDSAEKLYNESLDKSDFHKINGIIANLKDTSKILPQSSLSCLDYFWDRKYGINATAYKHCINLSGETYEQKKFREENEATYRETQGNVQRLFH